MPTRRDKPEWTAAERERRHWTWRMVDVMRASKCRPSGLYGVAGDMSKLCWTPETREAFIALIRELPDNGEW